MVGSAPSVTTVNYTLGTASGAHVYNGSDYLGTTWGPATIFGNSYSAWQLGTDYSFQYNGSTVTGLKNVGTYNGISVQVLKSGFVLASTGNTDGNLTITAKPLTVTGTIVAGKTYDGNASASLSGGALLGVVGSDSVTLAQAGTFADKNVGSSKTVTAADTLSGTDAGNYSLTQPTGLSASITAKALTVSGTTVAGKTYDGSASASVSGGALLGVVGSDSVTLTQAGTFADKNVGSSKAVTAADTLSGTDASNYSLTQPTGLSASITTKALTVTGSTVAGKTYDGNASASLSGGALLGVVGSDSVTLAQAGTFADKNVGSSKAVTAADTLSGTDAGNYSLAQPTGLSANITTKALTVSGTTVAGKTYDGNASASVSGGALLGVVGSDSVTLTQAGTFADKNVGSSKAVTAADTLSGTDAGNYSLAQPTGLSASITAKALTVTGSTADSRVFDGSTLATVTPGDLSGLIGNETVLATATGQFDAATPGTHGVRIAYSLHNGSNSGLSSNYSLADSLVTATIRPNTALESSNTSAAGLATSFSGTSGAVATIPAVVNASPSVLSAPPPNEPTQWVTLTQARHMAGATTLGEVRVPASRNALADIVNGGVLLPAGVEQQLFVVLK